MTREVWRGFRGGGEQTTPASGPSKEGAGRERRPPWGGEGGIQTYRRCRMPLRGVSASHLGPSGLSPRGLRPPLKVWTRSTPVFCVGAALGRNLVWNCLGAFFVPRPPLFSSSPHPLSSHVLYIESEQTLWAGGGRREGTAGSAGVNGIALGFSAIAAVRRSAGST